MPGRPETDLRAALVAALSSLITTNGHYQLDIRWNDSLGQAPFDYDEDYESAPVEAKWLGEYAAWNFSVPAFAYVGGVLTATSPAVLLDHEVVASDPANFHLSGQPLCYAFASEREIGVVSESMTSQTCAEIEPAHPGWAPIETRFYPTRED